MRKPHKSVTTIRKTFWIVVGRNGRLDVVHDDDSNIAFLYLNKEEAESCSEYNNGLGLNREIRMGQPWRAVPCNINLKEE